MDAPQSHPRKRGAGDARPLAAQGWKLQPALGVAGALILPGAFVLMRQGVQPFATHFYDFAWWSLIAVFDGVVWLRTRRSLLGSSPRAFALLTLWSVAAWFFFEIVNLRLENWYYACVPAEDVARWVGSFIAFGTVLPAIYLAHRMVDSFLAPEAKRAPCRRAPSWIAPACLAAGGMFLLLPLVWPRLFFPLAWGFLFLLLEPINYRTGAGSLIRSWERRSYRTLGTYLAAGLLCGILWELLNYWARIKWIYTVPGFEELKLFEMPIAGFLGFPPFAVECFVLIAALERWALVPSPDPETPMSVAPARRRLPGLVQWSAAAGAAVVTAGVALPAMDRFTVGSLYPGTARVAAAIDLPRSTAERHPDAFALLQGLRSGEVALDQDRYAFVELVTLAGIGVEKARALREVGVRTVADLADASDEALYERLRPPVVGGRLTRAEIRVWIRAARKARCGI